VRNLYERTLVHTYLARKGTHDSPKPLELRWPPFDEGDDLIIKELILEIFLLFYEMGILLQGLH
jgi:hypothetical protein